MKKIAILTVLSVLTLSACAPVTTVNSYVDASLSKASITQGGITVLPLLLGSSVKDANVPELRRELSRRTGTSIKTIFPSAKVISAEETNDIIEKGQLLDSFSAAAAAFDSTGLLKSDVLNKISDASGTRYIILPYLQNTNALSTAGSFGIITTSYSASFSMVIWDKQAQKSVYEGSGKATVFSNLFDRKNVLDAAYEAFGNAGVKIAADIK